MPTLQDFTCKDGKKIDIITQTAPHYWEIGIVLLNDESGAVVQGIADQHTAAAYCMTEIYKKWLGKDGVWKNLIACLQKCQLNVLAEEIKAGVGM